MIRALLTVELRFEQHVVLARQRARQLAALLGFDTREQTRIATAVSEIARNALKYAGGGRVQFEVESGPPALFRITVRDQGPGIPDLPAVLDGRYQSQTGLGIGLSGSRRLMDRFEITSEPGEGTSVLMEKRFPAAAPAVTSRLLARIGEELARAVPEEPLVESQRQNQELLRTLEELRVRQAEVEELNRKLADTNDTLEATNLELAETNRGMVVLYAELDDKAEQLQRASELKSRFLSYVSHEFRTPLGSILRLSQLLLDRLDGDLTSEQEKQVTLIRKSSEGLADMVNDLLDLARIEAGKTPLHAARFEVAGLFGALRGMFRPLVVNAQVELVVEEPEGIPALYTDEGKVSQVLRNFISNALKFTQQGEVRVSAASGPEGTVVFAVADTGIGIAPEDQERIFEEFAQVESAMQRRVKGTGLGLPLSRRLAELLGGAVAVRSEPGVGSTFSLTVPVVCPGEEGEIRPLVVGANRAEGADGERAEECILIVDDDETSRYVLRRLLARAPYRILEAEGGQEGLKLARQPGVRAILLDLAMPDLRGEEVLRRLKEDPVTREIPVIVVTSQVLDSGRRTRLEAGAVALLSKLTSASEMTARTREALAAAGVPWEIPARGGCDE